MKAEKLLDLSITWAIRSYPDAVLMPEMSVFPWGGALVDLAIITPERIVGVEIKGEGDSPSRLELQGLKYGQVCEHMWLLVTPEGTLQERCQNRRPNGWGQLFVNDGMVSPAIRYRSGDHVEYREPSDSRSLNPWAMCGTLWRDELYRLCVRHGVTVNKSGRSARVDDLSQAIVDQMPVPQIHAAMIEALREREWHESQRRRLIDKRENKPSGKPGQRRLL